MYKKIKKPKINIVIAISFLVASVCVCGLAVKSGYRVNIKSFAGEFSFEPVKSVDRDNPV
jgi:hypothetical protein